MMSPSQSLPALVLPTWISNRAAFAHQNPAPDSAAGHADVCPRRSLAHQGPTIGNSMILMILPLSLWQNSAIDYGSGGPGTLAMMDLTFYSVLNWRKALGVLGRDMVYFSMRCTIGGTVQNLATTWDTIFARLIFVFYAPASAGIGIFSLGKAARRAGVVDPGPSGPADEYTLDLFVRQLYMSF